MKRSTERILSTHVGSLPRPDDLIRTIEGVKKVVRVGDNATSVVTARGSAGRASMHAASRRSIAFAKPGLLRTSATVSCTAA